MKEDNEAEIIIIGAGAAGLMAARELSRAGKKVIILEARDRIGGRIAPIPEKEFGYPAQGGAEFVHGKSPITMGLFEEAGIEVFKTEGDMWNSRYGEITLNNERVPNQDELHKRLKELDEDMAITDFLEKYFKGEKYFRLRDSIIRLVEGYDAADPKRTSTFDLRNEWLSGEEWLQFRVSGGYGKLLEFLESQIKKDGVEIILSSVVKKINSRKTFVEIITDKKTIYKASKAIVTVPLPIIKSINFNPIIPEKLEAVEKMGFGGVIKVILGFRDRWWVKTLGKDFSEMDFLLSNETFHAWWTKYPEKYPVLTGWIAGPITEKFKNLQNKEILEVALEALSKIFKVKRQEIEENLLNWKVFNWSADPLVLGGYSYATFDTESARLEIIKPIESKIFFAGEALYGGVETSTVEGALGSGKETAKKILQIP